MLVSKDHQCQPVIIIIIIIIIIINFLDTFTPGAALERVSASPSLELLVVTNTIPQDANVEQCRKLRQVDVTPTFAEAVKCKQERRSLDNVFRMDMFEKLVLS